MSVIFNKHYASTQLYNNKSLTKKQLPKSDQLNNAYPQYSTNPARNNFYSTNIAFTGYAIRVLAKEGKLCPEVFQTTKTQREINKLFNDLANSDDSTSKGAKILENTKKEIEALVKNKEITKIPGKNLEKPFKKLLSSQPDKVRSGSRLVKWLIDINLLPQNPNIEEVYKNLLKDTKTVSPLMEVIGYFAEGNRLEKVPDNVVAFIKGKSKFGNPEEINIANDALNKLHKAKLIKEGPSSLISENVSKSRSEALKKTKLSRNIPIENIGSVLTDLHSSDTGVAIPAMNTLKEWIKDGSINNKNNLISVDNIKEFFNLVKKDNDVSQQIGLTIIDSLANYNNRSLRQIFADDANAIKPILDKFDPEVYNFNPEDKLTIAQKIAIKATHKLIQNNYIRTIPERHAEFIAKRLDPENIKNTKDMFKIGHTLKTVRKLVENYIKEKKTVNFIPDKNILYILDLTHHPNEDIAKDTLKITKDLLEELKRTKNSLDKTGLIKNIPDKDVKGILENLNKENSYILNYSMSIIRLMIENGIKKPGDFITQDHVKRILELTGNSFGHVSSSAMDAVNTLLKADFGVMRTSINYKTAGDLINRLNSDDPGVVLATMRLLPTLDRAGLIEISSNHKTLFRNQTPDGIDNVVIQNKKLENILEKINSEKENEQYYALCTLNILTKHKFIDKTRINTNYLDLIEEISESGNSKLNDPATMILVNVGCAKKRRK